MGAQSSATGTVIDNDSGALPSVSIADAAAVSEGGVLSFTLTRTGDTTEPLTVNLTSGTRRPAALSAGGNDYTAPTSVTFAAGSATAIVNVQTLDDTQDEADETVTLSIGPGSGYVSGQTQATGTILDNDAPFTGTPATITVVATDGSGTEAADGSPDFTFTFTRTGDTSQALSVNYNVSPGGAYWAFPGQDINTASSGIVLFAAGSATATLTFDAINDLQAENTESFTVSISPDIYINPSYTIGAQSSATGTVIDNDSGALPSVSIADAAAVSEGGVLSFTLTRTGDTTEPLTVNLASWYSAADSAGGNDYTAPTSVTFAAGSATAIVNVQTLDDTQDEADETVTLSIGPGYGSGIWLCGKRADAGHRHHSGQRCAVHRNACHDHGCGDGRERD